VQELSALGARSMRAFFDAHAAPRARLLCAYAGSDYVSISHIPAALALKSGEVLAAAATASDAPMDRSDALCGFVDPSQWTRAPGMVELSA